MSAIQYVDDSGGAAPGDKDVMSPLLCNVACTVAPV